MGEEQACVTEGNWTGSVTDPIQQEHSAFIHVEMSFDAFGLCIRVFLKAAADSGQFDCGQVEGTEHTGKHSQRGQAAEVKVKTSSG